MPKKNAVAWFVLLAVVALLAGGDARAQHHEARLLLADDSLIPFLSSIGDAVQSHDSPCEWNLAALIQSVDLNSTAKNIEYVSISETIEHEQHAVLRAEDIARNGVWRKRGGLRIFHPATRVVSISLAQLCR